MTKLLPLLLLFYLVFTPIQEASAFDSSKYLQALEEFEAIIAKDVQAGKMPRQAEPRTGELLDIITDWNSYLGSQLHTSDDLAALAVKCNRTAEIYKKFLLFGLDDPNSVLRAPRQISKDARDMVERNLLSYQPEMVRLEVFLLRCISKQLDIVRGLVASASSEQHDALTGGINQMRRGAFGIFMSALSKSTDGKFPVPLKIILATTLSDVAQSYSDVFQPNLREPIVRILATRIGSEADEELETRFISISGAMSISKCEGLCKY